MDITQIIVSAITQVLTERGQEYVNDLRTRLAGHNLTESNLYDSISFNVSGTVLTVSMAEYADFVDQGRSAGKFPPPNAIQDWVQRKGLQMSDGPRNLEQNQKSLSYLIGRKISNEGIPARGFIDPDPTEEIANDIVELIETRISEELMK